MSRLSNVIGSLTFSNQTASLRGLGGQATLVLVNGKRVGTFGGAINGAEGVNLASIPFTAIDRVEVLKDGASAIYGSDAIAGVINFIMRQDFTGVEATAWAGTPTRTGGGDQYNFKATAGYGDLAKDKYNVFLTASYDDQKNLTQRDRNFSAHSYITSIGLDTSSGNTFPGFVSTGGIGSFVEYPACPNPNFESDGRCRFDPSQYQGVQQIPDTKQLNFFGSGRYQINNDWQAYMFGSYSKQESRYVIQPVPLSDQFATPPNNPIFPQYPLNTILLPPTSPYYPHAQAIEAGVDGQPLNVRYRAVENGNRDTTDTNQQWNIVAGAKGFAWNWDFDASFNYGENTTKQVLNGGFPLLSRILPLLNSGVVNLFGPNTPEVTQQILATNYNGPTFNGKLTGYGIDVKGSGEIYNLPAGPLALALGVQAGKETLTQDPAEILATGDISGFGGNLAPFSHSRTVWAVFGELNIPILKSLEGNIAVRYDHYSDFGSTTNPKVSMRWQPLPTFLMRASWGTGFLAPTLYELWNTTVQSVTPPGVSDPLRCPTTGDSNDCDTQFTTSIGGSPDLQPTKSNQTTIGGVWEPVPGVSIGLDWFYLTLKDQLTTGVPIATILGDLDQYGYLVTRGPVQPAFPTLPGPITSVYQHWINLGQTKIQGIDVDARFKLARDGVGAVQRDSHRDLLHRLPGAAERRQFCRFRVERIPGARHRHHATMEELCGVELDLRPLDGDARQFVPELLHRRADRPRWQSAQGGHAEPVGYAGKLYRLPQSHAHDRGQEPVRHGSAVDQPEQHVPGRLRSVLLRRAGALRLWKPDLLVQITGTTLHRDDGAFAGSRRLSASPRSGRAGADRRAPAAESGRYRAARDRG